MKRRNIVRLVSFLSAAIVMLSGFLIKGVEKNQRLKLEIQSNYSKSLSEFSTSLNNVSLILKKAQFAASPASLARYAAELLCEAEISKSSLSQLPKSVHPESLNRFLSQAGNYAFAVSSKLYKGETAPSDFTDNLKSLSETAENISKIAVTAQINYDNLDYWAKEIEKEIDDSLDDSLSKSISKIEGEFSDYPTLVYDGPYSDHLLNKSPAMIENSAVITESQARSIASDFAKLSELEYKGEDKGKIESYHFGTNDFDITVSQKGGYVVYMRKSREIGERILSHSQALEKAKRFLDEKGIENFVETYYFIDEGVCTINFAFLDGETVCYTDLIKVGVAMDNGDIVLYEASGYLSNHTERAFESAVYTKEQAAKMLAPSLVVEKSAVALIPTKSGKEARCYEFTCTDGETEVLVYINLLNLEQEETLILLKTDGGTLVK